MRTTLGEEHLATLERLIAVLDSEPAVKQMQVLELLITRLVCRMGSERDSVLMAKGIHKHVLQLVDQTYRFKGEVQ